MGEWYITNNFLSHPHSQINFYNFYLYPLTILAAIIIGLFNDLVTKVFFFKLSNSTKNLGFSPKYLLNWNLFPTVLELDFKLEPQLSLPVFPFLWFSRQKYQLFTQLINCREMVFRITSGRHLRFNILVSLFFFICLGFSTFFNVHIIYVYQNCKEPWTVKMFYKPGEKNYKHAKIAF